MGFTGSLVRGTRTVRTGKRPTMLEPKVWVGACCCHGSCLDLLGLERVGQLAILHPLFQTINAWRQGCGNLSRLADGVPLAPKEAKKGWGEGARSGRERGGEGRLPWRSAARIWKLTATQRSFWLSGKGSTGLPPNHRHMFDRVPMAALFACFSAPPPALRPPSGPPESSPLTHRCKRNPTTIVQLIQS